MMRTTALVMAGLIVATTAALAQTAVSVRPVPSEGRTTHVTTTQDLSISATGLGGLGPIAMQSAGSLTVTQVNKTFNEQGRMEAELVIEKLEMTRSLNGAAERGTTAPTPVGQKVVAIFDRAGKLDEVKTPNELLTHAASVRQLLNGVYGLAAALPEMPMTVGETRIVDAAVLPMRLPGVNLGAALPKLSVTLRAVDLVNGDRIARLTQQVESAGAADGLTVNGTGTMDVNLDKGFVTASAMDWSLGGALPAFGGGGAQPVRVEAAFKMTLSASE